MVDQPQSEESGVSKPTYTTDETAKAFTTLLNKETASNEQLEPETTENKGGNSKLSEILNDVE